jgi:adenylate cyclase class 2
MPNIEIKAHYPNIEKAKTIAERVATKYLGLDHQIDTYFCTAKGRLKLRESSLSGAMLIPYIRSDISGPKKSEYALLQTQDPCLAKRLLTDILGVETVVEKHRDIYLSNNVRIHIDNVKGLGAFIEFEAVYSDNAEESAEYEKVRRLISEFQIPEADLIQGSYRERATQHQEA